MKHLLLLIGAFFVFACYANKTAVKENSTINTIDTTQKETVTDTSVSATAETVAVKPKTVVNHEAWTALLKKHVTKTGKVNYQGFREDADRLKAYIKSLSKQIPTKSWTKDEKLAYWINAYNAMTVDLILKNYPLESIKNIDNPWKQELWTLEGKEYDLNTIEHKILRKMNEPRMHFAINCASFSCPPLLNKAFTAENMDAQLTHVTKTFLADSKRNTITQNKVEISKIFKWFSSDFKENGSLIDFLNKYSAVKISKDADVDYKEYDWTLNE
ncbi:hypothetical protein IMCC3317_24160 [Kordia antarctica]|uniref:DUF547 domain-containing protein n=1 Tax=Kordia antarctica TaxID=1218801 RepID=A0A7L4ZJZ6_9FLAO|nr:DUF547 domain-containing protein [Kordia antarctica]QHI37038.1 hypothetical protein IMCC3317_24160 [Kordia antarctica]